MNDAKTPRESAPEAKPDAATPSDPVKSKAKPVEEIGGPDGPDPTRFGDWSVNGRCIDF